MNHAEEKSVSEGENQKYTIMENTVKSLLADKGTKLVEFYASWCPHCQKMMPVVDDVRALLDGKAHVYQFDIDDFEDIAKELDVESIPTFIVYSGDEEKWRFTGEIDGNTLYTKVTEYL